MPDGVGVPAKLPELSGDRLKVPPCRPWKSQNPIEMIELIAEGDSLTPGGAEMYGKALEKGVTGKGKYPRVRPEKPLNAGQVGGGKILCGCVNRRLIGGVRFR